MKTEQVYKTLPKIPAGVPARVLASMGFEEVERARDTGLVEALRAYAETRRLCLRHGAEIQDSTFEYQTLTAQYQLDHMTIDHIVRAPTFSKDGSERVTVRYDEAHEFLDALRELKGASTHSNNI